MYKQQDITKPHNFASTEKHKPILPKKVISSIKTNNGIKSASTGKIYNSKNAVVKPKKTTKSALGLDSAELNHCKVPLVSAVGDSSTIRYGGGKGLQNRITTTRHCDNQNDRTKTRILTNKNRVQQFYKNENFHQSSASVQDVEKRDTLLDTIKEVPEVKPDAYSLSTDSNLNFIPIHPKSSDADTSLQEDFNDEDVLNDIKQFRQKNYFECHSAHSRLKHKKSEESKDHKCFYNFYLNERLFLVPIKTDHKNTIRCIECSLPVDFDSGCDVCYSNREDRVLNGTIQAKVSFGDDKVKDTMILLPVRENLIIKEKRKAERNKLNEDLLYFGIVKLDGFGNSLFCKNAPSNSLALRYEKGYRECDKNVNCKYSEIEDNDVIFI